MFFSFLPRLEAQEILERHYEQESARGEIEAEIGSSYFYGGASSWDASSMARAHVDQMREDFDRSAEGQIYLAQVEAAEFMQGATRDLDVVTVEEINDPRIFTRYGATRVPEFYPDGPRKGLFNPAGPDRPFADEDIPF